MVQVIWRKKALKDFTFFSLSFQKLFVHFLTSAMSHPQSLHCYINKNMLHLLHPLHLKDFQQLQRKSFIYSILYRYQTLFRTRIIVQKCAPPHPV